MLDAGKASRAPVLSHDLSAGSSGEARIEK